MDFSPLNGIWGPGAGEDGGGEKKSMCARKLDTRKKVVCTS